MNKLFEAIHPINVAKVAGSGNKIVHLLDRKSDYYINLVPGFKFWDMCASDALIKSMNGVVTDAKGNDLEYDDSKNNFTIKSGIIVAKNKKTYEVCEERIMKKL